MRMRKSLLSLLLMTGRPRCGLGIMVADLDTVNGGLLLRLLVCVPDDVADDDELGFGGFGRARDGRGLPHVGRGELDGGGGHCKWIGMTASSNLPACCMVSSDTPGLGATGHGTEAVGIFFGRGPLQCSSLLNSS